MHPLPSLHIRRAVQSALEEDAAWGDITTAALFPRPTPARGIIVARHPMTVAGVAVAREVFRLVDAGLRVVTAVEDGTAVGPGTAVLAVHGDGRSLLIAERVALNFLQRLSGIATLTARFCAAVRGYRTAIVDTRKTTPGLRVLEKWAVRLGGGLNHRHSLGDGLLIKDNHLALLKGQRVSVAQAYRTARERGPHGMRIMVEAESPGEVRQALDGRADVILLDNMTPARVREAVALIKGRAVVEVSGGITLERARDLAAAGADYLSIGALTHSAPAADLSMDIVSRGRGRRRRR